MLNRNEILSSLTLEMLAPKNIKKQKRLVSRLEALYLFKNTYFAFTLVQCQNSDQEKKSFLKFLLFKGTSRP